MSELRKLVKRQCKIPYLGIMKKNRVRYLYWTGSAEESLSEGRLDRAKELFAYAGKFSYYRPNNIRGLIWAGVDGWPMFKGDLKVKRGLDSVAKAVLLSAQSACQ